MALQAAAAEGAAADAPAQAGPEAEGCIGHRPTLAGPSPLRHGLYPCLLRQPCNLPTCLRHAALLTLSQAVFILLATPQPFACSAKSLICTKAIPCTLVHAYGWVYRHGPLFQIKEFAALEDNMLWESAAAYIRIS